MLLFLWYKRRKDENRGFTSVRWLRANCGMSKYLLNKLINIKSHTYLGRSVNWFTQTCHRNKLEGISIKEEADCWIWLGIRGNVFTFQCDGHLLCNTLYRWFWAPLPHNDGLKCTVWKLCSVLLCIQWTHFKCMYCLPACGKFLFWRHNKDVMYSRRQEKIQSNT